MTTKHCGHGLAGLCVLLILLTMIPGVCSGAALAAPADKQPQLVFSSFPSDGMSELFRRILSEAYEELGYGVSIWKLPAERALIMANEGLVDGEAARVSVIEKDCSNLIRVPTPIYLNRIAVFTKRTDYDPESGFQGLSGHTLCIRNGYKFLEKSTQGMECHSVADYEKMLTLVESDRVEFGLAEYFDILPTLGKVRLDGVRVLEKPLATNRMYHYLHRRHADLVPRVDAVLLRMKTEGRMDQIARAMMHEFLCTSLTPCPMMDVPN